jgi:hypothetical protein
MICVTIQYNVILFTNGGSRKNIESMLELIS